MKKPSDVLILTDGKEEIAPETFFIKVEELVKKKFGKYSESLFPMTLLYCGGKNPYDAMLMSIGILAGVIMERKGLKIKLKDRAAFENIITTTMAKFVK